MTWPITLDIDVLWGDMDAFGHVNNTRYLVWFESVRMGAFERIGVKAEPTGVGPILATTTCNYLQPVAFPEALTAGCRVPSVGNTSFAMEYGVWRRDHPDDLVATGSGVIVMVDYRSGNKVRVSDAVRQAIAGL